MHLQLFISATVLALSSFVTDVQSKGDDPSDEGVSVEVCKDFVRATMDSEGITDPTRRNSGEKKCDITSTRQLLKQRFALECKIWCKQNNVRKEHPENCELVCSNPTFDRRYVLLHRERQNLSSSGSTAAKALTGITTRICQIYARAAFDDAGDYNQMRRSNADFICEHSKGLRIFLKELFVNDCRRQCTKNNSNKEHPENCVLLCQSATYDPKYVVLNRPTAIVRFPAVQKEMTSTNHDEGISVEDCKEYAHAGLDKDGNHNPEDRKHADFVCENSRGLRIYLKELFGRECRDWCIKNNVEKEHPDNCELVCRNPTFDRRYVIIKSTYIGHTGSEDPNAISIEDCKAYAHAGLDKYGDHDPKHREHVDSVCENSHGLRVFLKELFGRECRDWCIKNNVNKEHPDNCSLVCRNPHYDPAYVIIKQETTIQHPMITLVGVTGAEDGEYCED